MTEMHKGPVATPGLFVFLACAAIINNLIDPPESPERMAIKQTSKEGNLDTLVDSFSDEPDLSRLREIAIGLSKPGATTKAAKSPRFMQRVAGLVAEARNSESNERLQALVILGRLRQQAKAIAARVDGAMSEPAPPLMKSPSELTDPLDRAYLARILDLIRFDGRARYLADFVASEPLVQTDARALAMFALLRAAPTLSISFQLLDQSMREQTFETKEPATSKARLVLRVIEGMRNSLKEVDVSVDQEAGTAYAQFLARNLPPVVEIDRSVATELAVQILYLLIEFVRPNFSLMRLPETFDAVGVANRLFSPASWPATTETARAALAKMISEAITLLAQAGVTDQRLRRILVILYDEQRAQAILKKIAHDAPGINNEVRHWLETGRSVEQLAALASVEESLLTGIDREIARTFRDASLLISVKNRLTEDLLYSIGSQPSLREGAELLFSRIDTVYRDSSVLAASREFELRDNIGDVVEYSPNDHEADNPMSGKRFVTIRAPRVVRVQGGRAPRIVLKASVVEES